MRKINVFVVLIIGLLFAMNVNAQTGLISAPTVQNAYGFFTATNLKAAGGDTVLSGWFPVGVYSNVALGFVTNDSSKFQVTVDYGVSQSVYGTTVVTAGDTLSGTSNTGNFLTFKVRGYNSSGTFIDRIPAASYIRVRIVTLSGGGTNYQCVGRVIFKN